MWVDIQWNMLTDSKSELILNYWWFGTGDGQLHNYIPILCNNKDILHVTSKQETMLSY